MKLSIINTIAGVLAGVKINKISDRAAKDEISKSYLAVRKALRPFERDRDDLVEKFRSDWKDEIAAILAKDGGDHTACIKAQEDLNNTIVKMLEDGTADVAFTTVKADILFNPDLWFDNATLGEIDKNIAFLVKHGVAEE